MIIIIVVLLIIFIFKGKTVDYIAFIKGFEGFRPQPYDDYGQQSVGYGTKYLPDMALPMDRRTADQLLRLQVDTWYRPMAITNLAVRGIKWANLNTAQRAAVISFVYNLGPGVILSASWPGHWLRGDMDKAALSWRLHSTAGGGVRLPGLVRRRFAEWLLFSEGKLDFHPPGWEEFYEAHA